MKIRELTLEANKLEELKTFYSEVLGFPLVNNKPQEFMLTCGATKLRFQQANKATPYHFAFNIPPYSEHKVLDWLEERVEVLKDEESKIQLFEKWNARAIYFYDPDKNIVEFISRRSLDKRSSETFSIDEIINISEIGVAADEPEALCNLLISKSKVPVYDGDLNRFTALGDEHGLFICINKNIKNWFPTNDVAFSSNFNIIFEQVGQTWTAGFVDGSFKLYT